MKTNRQPFQDTIDTAMFYGGGARREIVDDIKTAFAEEVQLLTLAGTDGSGKTMICRVVEQELQGEAEILFFEQGAESFDEVVNRIAAHLELEEIDQTDRNTRLEEAVEILEQQDRRLILILDGAEKIFLATLERIRRMLDQVNSSQLTIQLLISGRPLFSLNFKQLAIINFKEVKEKHFSLDPLDGKATHLYLNHCLDQSDTEEQKRFSLSQAEEIADIARGNFKLINQLARKLHDLKRLASEKEEAVEDYNDGADLSGALPQPTTGLAKVDLDFLKVPKIGARWYAVGAGFVVLILLIALLRGGGEEETVETLPGAENVPDLTLEKVEPDPIDIPEPSRPVEPLQPPSPGLAPEEVQPTVTESRPPDTAPEPIADTPEPPVQEPSETQAEVTSEPASDVNETIAGQAPLPESAPELEVGTLLTDSPKVEVSPSVKEGKDGARTAESVTEAVEERVAEQSEAVEETVSEAVEERVVEQSEAVGETVSEAVEERVVEQSEAVEETVSEALEERVVEQSEAVEETVSEAVEERVVEQSEAVEETVSEAVEERVVEQSETVEETVTDAPAMEPIEESVEIQEESTTTQNLAVQSDEAETQPSEETATIQNLTVQPKKLPTTESASVAVVTLREESKIRPDQPVAPAPAADTVTPQGQDAESTIAEARPPLEAEPEVEQAIPESRPEQVASLDRSDEPVDGPQEIKPKAEVQTKDSSVYYAQRLAAGSRWLVGGSREKYTVQLMVLSSEDAQQNVRYMLSEETYQPIVDQLFILRKIGQPQTVMLYWGEFDTPAEARQARDRLPRFLSRLEPFEIPVKDAVAKARAGQ